MSEADGKIEFMFDESDMSVAQRAEERLPKLAAVFNAGRVDFRIFATVAYRTGLIADPDVLALLDGQLARFARRWTSMSWEQVADLIDRWVAELDPGAVRSAGRARRAEADGGDGRFRLGA